MLLHLEMVEEHLFELLNRGASVRLIEHWGFSSWLRLLAQLVVTHLPQFAADDPTVVPPASCVHLEKKQNVSQTPPTMLNDGE